MRQILAIVASILFGTSLALAHQGRIVDLKTAAADHQVEAVGYCNGIYTFKLKDGSTSTFKEFNLRIKTDSGPNGPNPDVPVLISAGMRGDRVFLIFSGLDELKTVLKKTCQSN